MDDNRIPKSQLDELFAQIREESPWNIDEDMVWGYFFTGDDPEVLEKAGLALEKQGYELIGIMEPEEEEDGEPPIFLLHMAKIETHSPESLHQRNQELYDFAEKNGLASYDGMDVGPIDGDDDGEDEIDDDDDEVEDEE